MFFKTNDLDFVKRIQKALFLPICEVLNVITIE